MLESTLVFIANISIMLITIYFFNIIGQVINHKYFKDRFNYSILIGFIFFLAMLEIVSFPFILVQSSFTLYLIAYVLAICLWIVYIYINRNIINFKPKLIESKIEIAMIIVWFAIVAMRSVVYSDSWLYSTMITSTVENNLIFSNNGFLAMSKLDIMHHRFESYYLFQSVLSVFFRGTYLLALVSSYKLLDATIVILSFLELAKQFNLSKYRSYVFTAFLLVMMAAADTILDGSFLQTTEPPIQMFQISTGTSLFHTLVLPMMLIYLKVEGDFTWKQKNYFLIPFVLFNAAISTTFYYTFPLYFITILIVKQAIYKQKDNQVLFAFLLTWVVIITSFAGVFTESLWKTTVIFSMLVIITKVIMFIYKKLGTKIITYLTYVGVAGYVLILVLGYDKFAYMAGKFTTDKQLLRMRNLLTNINNGNFDSAIIPGVMLIILIIIVLRIVWTKNKYRPLFLYSIIFSILFFNNSIIAIYYKIGIGSVVSRVAAASLIGYIVTLYAIDKLANNHLIKVVFILYFSFGVSSILANASEYAGVKNSYKNAVNRDLGDLASYPFEDQSFFVVDNLDASVGSEHFYQGLNKLVVLRPDLSWSSDIDSCNQLYQDPELSVKYSHCYTIYPKATAPDQEYIFETDRYVMKQDF